jgi:hypothetical protein
MHTNGTEKSVTITGLHDKTGHVIVSVIDAEENLAAVGIGTISGGTAAMVLTQQDGLPWTGSGDYYIFLVFQDDPSYIFTDGGDVPANPAQAPRYCFTAPTASFSFAQFKPYALEE